jgi:predicted RNA-binding Zn-ribbon protein involved in translation (DUF1610 family)
MVLQLRCPTCGGTLHGTSQAVLFWCEDCGALQEVINGQFVARRVQAARPLLAIGAAQGHLPVWAFRVRANWTWPDEESAAAKTWKAPDWVYVTAFALSNGFYFGDPGLIFTQKRVVLSPGDRAPLVGGTRGLEEAKVFVEPHLLSILDRRQDVTGVELSCVIDEAVLWAIPFSDDGITLTDGILGLKLPGAALDEIGALRAWWGKRR